MIPSGIQNLTDQFYRWEERGRGYWLYDIPVDIEPPFEPFYFHEVQQAWVDDGLASTTGVFGLIANVFKSKKKVPELPVETIPETYPYQSGSPIHELQLSLPKGYEVRAEESEQLLIMLSTCQHPVSFELIATTEAITLQLACRQEDLGYVSGQLKAYFPECLLHEKTTPIEDILDPKRYISTVDLGLRQEFMRPIQAADSFAIDPLTGVFGSLEHLREDERVIIQILFKGTVDPWAESIINSVTDWRGHSFFLNAPEMPKLAREKIQHPLFAVVVRVAGQAGTWEAAGRLANSIANNLCSISQTRVNNLMVLTDEGYPLEWRVSDIVLRESHRAGMLLNSRELVNLVHLPSASVTASKIARETKKTRALPAVAEGHRLVLGVNSHQGKERYASLSDEQRMRHMHIIGATGTGKSTLLLNLMKQDIEQGKGIAVLDPHGDLIESILSHIPAHRVADTILVDPSDTAYPVGFNILSAHSEIEKEILSSDLAYAFRRLSTSWGDQMTSVLSNAILAFLESPGGGTLLDLRRFLIEKPFRESFLKTVTDPSVLYYWHREYPLLKSSSVGSITTRLDSFLRAKVIRNMVAQRKSLNFDSILSSGKILLVKLPQGLIGNENSYLLGTLFVSKLYQAAMARQAMQQEARNDFYCYIDEFQNFITPSMAAILSGARKYRLGLVLAHQDMQQLNKEDTELASAVMSNAGTRVCFRVGDADAKRFEDGFSFFDAFDLQNLATGEAIVRMEKSEFDFNLRTIPFDAAASHVNNRDMIIAQARERYAMPKEAIEADLLKMHQESLREPEKQAVTVKAEPPKREEPAKVEKEKVDLPAEEKSPFQESKPLTEQPVKERTVSKMEADKLTERLVNQKAISQHRYLQTLIKKMAEARGFKAVIEAMTPDGQGRVDVSLERNGKRIACEIGVTTSKAWEVHNIEKCLLAGYEMVVAVPIDSRTSQLMQKEIEKSLDAKLHSTVFVMEADALFHYLDTDVSKESVKETRMKGYRVKVEYDAVSVEEMKQKRNSIIRFVANSVKRNTAK